VQVDAAWGALLAAISALVSLRLAVLLVAAGVGLARERRRAATPLPAELPPLVVLVPAYNEVRVLEGTVASLLASDHPAFTVCVVDDGSTDGTAPLARRLAAADPRVRALVREVNAGKAAALNAALAATDAPHVVTVDADTLVAPDALRRLAARLADADAAASNVKVGNRLSWLTTWQSLEYVVGLNLHRRAQAALGCITTLPGAACAFRRAAIVGVGGFSTDTVVEDTDLTLALLAAGRRVVYAPDAVAFTEAPDTLAGLYRQRTRWARGYLQCLWKHRRSFLRADALGIFGMPDLLFVNLLVYALVPLSVPGIVALFAPGGVEPFLAAIGSLFALDLAIAAAAYLVDGERLRELVHAPARRVVWPFFLLVVFAVAVARSVRRATGWGKPVRRGTLAEAGKAGRSGVLTR
jgi:glycosyltransferase involved in cell wall biosynthesis